MVKSTSIFCDTFRTFINCLSFNKWIKSKQKNRKPNPWIFILIFFVINLLALFVFSLYYNHPERAQYDSVKILLKIEPFLWMIGILSILFCIVKVFGKIIAWVWNNFSFATSTVLDRWSTKYTALILVGFFVFGLGLRLINLDQYPPYVDEYIHTHTAFGVISGLPMTWNRAFLPVTLPVIISYRLFGVNLWAARLPMVVFNMLAIFPLYFIGKKVNKNIGFISIFLFTLNPWIIAASRTVREYAVIPLYFFLSAVFLLDLIEWEGMNRKQYLIKNSWKILILGLIAAYSLYDNQSILKS